MAVKPLRVGVVGTGFGRYHMEGSAVPGVEILAICDLNKAEQQFASQYGAKHVHQRERMFAMAS